MGRKLLIAAALASTGLLLSPPALADTKVGIEAWARGDYARALSEWQVAADGGDADATFNLGQASRLGRGTLQDLGKAERLYAKAAEQGHLLAADNYGLLLFQREAREEAMPYLRAASDRGDPRARYLLGVAHFNGKLVKQDWVRALALVSLADGQGLTQASTALAQMKPYLSEEQRSEAAALAQRLDADALALRSRQQVGLDLGDTVTGGETTSRALAPAPPARTFAAGPATAVPAAKPQVLSAAVPDKPGPVTQPKRAIAPRPAATTGPWRIQLGVFARAGGADALWRSVSKRPEVAGHARLLIKSGAMTRLLAGGYPSRAAAQAACTRLSAAGISCLAISE